MDKNTLTAIILSTVVVVASFILQPKLFPNAYSAQKEQVIESSQDEITSEQVIQSVVISENTGNVTEEKNIIINTNKAEIVLTNRGGDIVSYKLTKHTDIDTKDGVQMVDNVSAMNRACSIAFGEAGAPIINDLFNCEQKDDNTVLFTKRFTIKNDDGSTNSFVLGKRYTFVPDEFMFKLEVLIHSDKEDSTICVNDVSYNLRTSPQIGPHFNPKLNRYENRQFISYNGSKTKRQVLGTKQFKPYNKNYVWNGIGGKYFIELAIPESPSTMADTWYSTIVEKDDYANAQAILVRKAIKTNDVSDTYYMYYGPRNEKDFKIYNHSDNNFFKLDGLKLQESLQSNGWLGWLETVLKWMMEILNKFVHNWGISIITMTIIIKLIMFPFTKKQSMSTLKMQELQPKIQELQKKYSDNPQKQQTAMAELYKKAGYNPASGCLPMVVQFLILFAMYNLFNNYFEFRGASFIPGWIDDLSSGDTVYTFAHVIPFFGNQLRILPVIYLISQLLFGKITGNGGAAAPGSTQAQMQMMMYGMPIVFFFIFYNAPAGLLLYWTISNIFQMGQQIIINKMMKEKKAELAKKATKK